jgi:predicted outer membrane repeat protein
MNHRRSLSLIWQLYHVLAESCNTEPSLITVTSAADAAVLIKAALCPAATIRAVWQGSVQLPKTIVVADGTSLTLTGANVRSAVIDGASKLQLFNVFGDLTLGNLTLSNGLSGNGGAVYVQPAATVNMIDCTVRNSSANYGAGIYLASTSNVNITDSTLTNNSAAAAGGALYSLTDSTIFLRGVVMSGSFAAATGGAMNVQGALTGDRCDFEYNVALSRGGAINGEIASTLAFQSSSFVNNSCKGTFGALKIGHVLHDHLRLISSHVASCTECNATDMRLLRCTCVFTVSLHCSQVAVVRCITLALLSV